jgi:Icc protein
MEKIWHRRKVLQAGVATAGIAALGTSCVTSGASQPQLSSGSPRPRKILTIAHLTDTHVQPELNAQAGLAMALRHAQSHPAKPDIILSGGDNIMDGFAQWRERTTEVWKIWSDTVREECSLPLYSCIGNHDIWGWAKTWSKATGDEPFYGKQWAIDEMGLPGRYYSMDFKGVHLVMLDSTHTDGGEGYIAKLDEEQFEWLAEDLGRVPPGRHTVIVSHIPIVSSTVFFYEDRNRNGNWDVPGSWMHVDAIRLKDLFRQHPTVKVCLSGHMHMVDRVDYLGVGYICSGAVCAGWWKGPCNEFENGYTILELFEDGSYDWQYVEFGWTPAKA